MSQIKIGHWEQDGALVYIPCGFKPDWMLLMDQNSASGSAVFYVWWRELTTAATPKDGFSINDGTDAELADGSGFSVYDTGSATPTITEWAASTNYALKTSDATLCFVHPTVDATDEDGNIADRDAIYEVSVDAGSSGSTEPAWPVEIGGIVVDSGITWKKVNEATFRKGYQSFGCAAAIQTDSYEFWYIAIQGDTVEDHGDVLTWPGGVDPNF